MVSLKFPFLSIIPNLLKFPSILIPFIHISISLLLYLQWQRTIFYDAMIFYLYAQYKYVYRVRFGQPAANTQRNHHQEVFITKKPPPRVHSAKSPQNSILPPSNPFGPLVSHIQQAMYTFYFSHTPCIPIEKRRDNKYTGHKSPSRHFHCVLDTARIIFCILSKIHNAFSSFCPKRLLINLYALVMHSYKYMYILVISIGIIEIYCTPYTQGIYVVYIGKCRTRCAAKGRIQIKALNFTANMKHYF